MRSLSFAYGKGSAKVSVPEGTDFDSLVVTARAPAAKRIPDLLRCVVFVPSGDPVALVLPDETRPLDRAAVLEALAPALGRRAVTVVVGGGLHAAASIDAPWPVRVHDARSPDLVDVGNGLRIEPAVAAARNVIVVSCVRPHYLAGFAGGLKGLLPGVADEASILAVHRAAEQGPDEFSAALRERTRAIPARLLGVNLLVGPAGCFDATAGPLQEAHAEAVRRYEEACAQPRPEPADVVVADAGGAPTDATLLQAHKTYEAAARLARPGGMIVLVAACEDGYGHEEFRRRLFGEGEGWHPYARTARRWHEKAARFTTLMVTGMDVAGLGVERTTLTDAVERFSPGARVLYCHAPQELLWKS